MYCPVLDPIGDAAMIGADIVIFQWDHDVVMIVYKAALSILYDGGQAVASAVNIIIYKRDNGISTPVDIAAFAIFHDTTEPITEIVHSVIDTGDHEFTSLVNKSNFIFLIFDRRKTFMEWPCANIAPSL